MSNRFMISVAALALVAGTGLANAQGTMNRDSGGAGAQPAQQTQPGGAAEHGATGKDTMTKEKGTVGQAGGASTVKPGAAAEEKSPGAMKDEPAGGAMHKSATEDKAGAPKGQRTDERAQGQMDKSQQDKSKSTMDKSQTDKSKSTETDTKSGNMNAQTKGAETKGAESKSQTTTGNASATTAAPPAEKRAQISTAIKSTKIEETTNVNFNISVGTAVPSTVRFHPLPPQIVEIYPEWRGYDVIFVHGQYIIVRPQTHEIVYIIEG
jgi:hypothetical protein